MSPRPRLALLAATLTLAACPSSGTGDAAKTAAKADAKKADAKTTDAKKPDAKTPDAKTPDAKAPDAKVLDAKTPDEPANPVPELPPETEQAVAASINAFAVDLHKSLGAAPGNLFVSPASIAIAFAMTHAGAKGKT